MAEESPVGSSPPSDVQPCGLLVATSLSPATLTECGLTAGHEGECVPYTKVKRQVSYNQEAVLCPACKKRIRLNNNGKLRVHLAGKVGSDKCMGSNADPLTPVHFGKDNLVPDSSKVPDDPSLFSKDDSDKPMFSDID